MENLKNEILQEFKNYWAKEDKLIQDNAQYLDTEKYTEEFIQNKKAELDRLKEAYRKTSTKNFEMLEKKFIEGLKVDKNKIDSLEYQTKLSNILKIIELKDGNISRDGIQFMVNARDTDTLQALALKYNSNALKQALEESNINISKQKAEELIYHAKLHLRDFMGKPRKRSDVIQFFK